MHDYVYPSIFLAYLMFFLCFAGALFFLVRSRKDGYWGKDSEDPKYRMLADDDTVVKTESNEDSGD
ncbi:MAG TPA: cbb3-type cytochrome oxidase assembly protein CcoS [Candidatus Binatia bacterium]|nr:cbb3-type cytochrome oxidase assembly protein CcoS [Candidatus Binatia bacterium]